MKNYEAFVRMLTAANVAFTDKDTGQGHVVSVLACSGPNNEGYDGLYTTFTFNEHGELECVGSWEQGSVEGLAPLGLLAS